MGTNTTESAKWRKFLQPVVAGLALFLAAASTALNKTESDKADSRITAVEIRYDNLQERYLESGKDIAVMRETLSNIRSDVAFIRGQMEARERRK